MTIRCKECGSYRVQIAMWVRPNLAAQINENNQIDADAVVDDFGSWNSYDTQWCENCEEHREFTNDTDEGTGKKYGARRDRQARQS